MERTVTFFGKVGELASASAKWIIIFGRKYPLIPAFYLIVFVWFVFFRTPSLPPAVPSTSTPSTLTISSPLTPTGAPTPVINIAQVSAFRSGTKIKIRWTHDVTNHQIIIDGKKTNPSCQRTECTVDISNQPKLTVLEARWQESGQNFEKSFSF
ncbi:MAG: hypothetical protein QNJ54_25340 [Prochloraceae cyanobacterium]|nr:hypothetical protein [Prochloraceae cyanobacterium]